MTQLSQYTRLSMGHERFRWNRQSTALFSDVRRRMNERHGKNRGCISYENNLSVSRQTFTLKRNASHFPSTLSSSLFLLHFLSSCTYFSVIFFRSSTPDVSGLLFSLAFMPAVADGSQSNCSLPLFLHSLIAPHHKVRDCEGHAMIIFVPLHHQVS